MCTMIPFGQVEANKAMVLEVRRVVTLAWGCVVWGREC